MGIVSFASVLNASAAAHSSSANDWFNEHTAFIGGYGAAWVWPPLGPSAVGLSTLMDLSFFLDDWFAPGIYVHHVKAYSLDEYEPEMIAAGLSTHVFIGRLGIATGIAISSFHPNLVEYAGKTEAGRFFWTGIEIPARASVDVFRFGRYSAIMLQAEMAAQFLEGERAFWFIVGPILRFRFVVDCPLSDESR